MSADISEPEGTARSPGPVRREESLLRGGILGVLLVTLATGLVAAGGAIVALLISVLF